MLKKYFFLNILLNISLFIFSNSQQCILGTNCPYNQGICVADSCNCYKGYYTLLDESLPIDQQIYCNYRQISQYTPIIIEIILPGFGHLYVGKYWMALIKISLLLTFLYSSYYLYHEFRFPELFTDLFEKIGFSGIIGVEKKEDGENKEEEEKKEEEEEEEENNGKVRLRSGPNKKKEKFVVRKQFREEGEITDEPENQKKLIEKENDENKEDKLNKFMKIIFELSGIFISLLYFMDLFLYKFGVYNDGNDVPFI